MPDWNDWEALKATAIWLLSLPFDDGPHVKTYWVLTVLGMPHGGSWRTKTRCYIWGPLLLFSYLFFPNLAMCLTLANSFSPGVHNDC